MMVDVFSKEKRSEVMSSIRARGNKRTEIALVDLLRLHRITGWRRHKKIPIGIRPSGKSGALRRTYVRPDFVFPTIKLAVFVDGCFWHSCPKHGVRPASNSKFWASKLDYNSQRDRAVTRAMKKKGWVVIRIWEHDLPSSRVAGRISRAVTKCEQIRSDMLRSRL